MPVPKPDLLEIALAPKPDLLHSSSVLDEDVLAIVLEVASAWPEEFHSLSASAPGAHSGLAWLQPPGVSPLPAQALEVLMSKRPDLNLPSQPLKVEADREGVAPVTAILPWLSALPLQTRADPRDVLVEVVPEVLLAEVARLPVARGRFAAEPSNRHPGIQ